MAKDLGVKIKDLLRASRKIYAVDRKALSLRLGHKVVGRGMPDQKYFTFTVGPNLTPTMVP